MYGLSVEVPAVEIVVRAKGDEIALIAFFQNSSTEVGIALGIADPKLVDLVSSILEDASDAVRKAKFERSDLPGEGDRDESESTEAPPF